MGFLALEDDALGHDDAGAAGGIQVLGHVVDEQHLAAPGLHGEAVVGPDASLRRHERGIGEDHVGEVVPTVLAGEGVVLEDMRIDETVQVHVDEREAHHVRRYVIALEVARQPRPVVRGQGVVAVGVPVGGKDVLVGGDEKPGGAAGGVEDHLVFLRINNRDYEVDDVSGSTELPGVAL